MCPAVSVHAEGCERDGAMWCGQGAACALLVLAAALAGLSVTASASASALSDKRHDMSPVPFVMGSRYGRSSPRLMSPRNDKFFMGSRYGKRSDPMVSAAAAAAAAVRSADGSAAVVGAGAGASAGSLVCQYTGVYPLYRCLKHKRSRLNRRSFGDAANGDEQ